MMKGKDYAQLRVLIVDDQPDVLSILRNMLSELGITQIFEASDGAEAESFMNVAYDMVNLVICDWNLPYKDGLELLKKSKEFNPEKPFVMITGRCDINSVMKAKASGVNGYIRKPFSLTELEKKILMSLQDNKAA